MYALARADAEGTTPGRASRVPGSGVPRSIYYVASTYIGFLLVVSVSRLSVVSGRLVFLRVALWYFNREG